MSVMWLSYASVPVLQRAGREGSMGKVRETVQDMEAIHVFSAGRMSHLDLHCTVSETTGRDTCRVAVWDIH